MQRFANNFTTLTTNTLTPGSTSIQIESTTSDLNGITGYIPGIIPGSGDFFMATLSAGNDDAIEIVKVTARTTTTLTVVRAQEFSTAQDWPIGSTLQLRLTAKTMDNFLQIEPLDPYAMTAVGDKALNIQTGRTAEESVASGAYAVAVGYDTKASADNTVALGRSAVVANAESVAVGHGANSTGTYAVAVGAGAAAGNSAVAIGQDAVAASTTSIAIGQGSSTHIDSGQSVAIKGTANGSGSLAIAASTAAAAYAGSAIGNNAYVFGEYAMALNGGYVTPDRAMGNGGFWMIPADRRSDQKEYEMSGTSVVFATPPMDLGARPVWQASHTYYNGDIVKPVAGGALQYRMTIPADATTLVHPTVTSNTTEPTWTAVGNWTAEGSGTPDAYWIPMDLSTLYTTIAFHPWMTFFLTKLSFVCTEFSTLATAPTIAVGITGNDTALIASVAVSPTAAGQIYSIAVPNPCLAVSNTALTIKQINVPATGKAVGRFIIEGYFVEVPNRT